MAGLGAHAQAVAQTSSKVGSSSDKEVSKEVEGKMFLLCTYADSERWLSGIEPMLYPTGMTFYRPFSYKQRYFEPETLAEQLTDPSQSGSLVKNATWNEGFFVIRFSDQTEVDFLSLFIPLRRVSLAKVERADGFNLYFHLGPFVKPEYSQALRTSILPKFDLTSSVTSVSATKLYPSTRGRSKMARKPPRRDLIATQVRSETAARRIGDRKCACSESRPEALIAGSKPTMCAECQRKKRGQTMLDDHHVAGQANRKETIPVPANDHRARLSVDQYDWPKQTRENPEGSPVLAAAGSIRGFVDTLMYLLEKFILWLAEMLEVLDAYLAKKLGSKWWVGTGLEQFAPKR
jgi:hypothetical protein